MRVGAEEVSQCMWWPSEENRLAQTESVAVADVLFEPCRETFIMSGLRGPRRRVDPEHLSTDIRVLECAVQVRADDARSTHAVDAAGVQPRKRREVVAPIERRDAKMYLISPELRTSRRGRGHCLRLFLATEPRHRWKSSRVPRPIPHSIPFREDRGSFVPASDTRHRCPRLSCLSDAARTIQSARPISRSHARSAMVFLLPGRMMKS